MKKIFLITIMLFSSIAFSLDSDMHLAAGMRADSATSETSGVETEGKASFQAGGIGYWDLAENLMLRSGLMYTQRNYDVEVGTATVSEPRLSYIDVPVSGMFEINDFLGVFAGVNGSLNVSKECDGGCSGINTLPIAAQAGGAFEIAERLGLEIYYEQGITKIADEVEDPKVFVGQLMYAF